MSANLDLVRSIVTPWERGDFSSAEWTHTEIEYVSDEPPLVLGTVTGAAAMAKIWRNWLHAWRNFHVDADEYREVDGERVLVLLRYSGLGNPSGLEVMPIEAACLFHIRDGKVRRLVLRWDRKRVFADLGLSPEGEA